ncbi:hypothetical protein [Candidatus Protochlamydia amoebophila]|uniref:Secreted protein n=1 Tax=Candidatus Protochlamydia amoebophila TaxID=362787 RepID=A0A0C1H5P6_9BACT|nr:hypothetical protein [Candidatus Protochlamydia amoebophila]KIC72809.1 hypothetical protein DB44_CA00210 [Candidatus Protochlamydia amoebophila]
MLKKILCLMTLVAFNLVCAHASSTEPKETTKDAFANCRCKNKREKYSDSAGTAVVLNFEGETQFSGILLACKNCN